MVIATGEILLPRPFVFQRQQLINVGTTIDHPLFVDGNPTAAAVDGAEAGLIGDGVWLQDEWRRRVGRG